MLQQKLDATWSASNTCYSEWRVHLIPFLYKFGPFVDFYVSLFAYKILDHIISLSVTCSMDGSFTTVVLFIDINTNIFYKIGDKIQMAILSCEYQHRVVLIRLQILKLILVFDINTTTKQWILLQLLKISFRYCLKGMSPFLLKLWLGSLLPP
jgi:hypothetical protein